LAEDGILVESGPAELSKDQYEECVKAVKAGENDSRLRGEPLLMKHRVRCPSYLPHLCQRLELKKEDPRSIYHEKNYLHVYKLIDRRLHQTKHFNRRGRYE